MTRAWIRRILLRLLVFLSTGLISVTVFQTETQPTEPIQLKIVADTIPTEIEEPEMFVDYESDDTLSHRGYEVRKIDVSVPYDFPPEYGKRNSIEGTHVVVRQKGNTADFGGVYHPQGNFADFGLFDLLGNKSEQLIISLTAPRTGRHWVVNLTPEFRVLFDSADYDVGREDFSIIDIDKDGVHEICLPIVSFYGMEGLWSVSETPLPQIIFQYDAQQMKYLPANHLFVDYALRHLNPETESEIYEHHRFHVLLDYVYAGKENQGWVSFDKHYPSADKEVMKSRIKAVLKDDPVYKYIYKVRKR